MVARDCSWLLVIQVRGKAIRASVIGRRPERATADRISGGRRRGVIFVLADGEDFAQIVFW
jgi:hypothetical protein